MIQMVKKSGSINLDVIKALGSSRGKNVELKYKAANFEINPKNKANINFKEADATLIKTSFDRERSTSVAPKKKGLDITI